MTSWRKEEIEIADGTKVLAQMPVIVSASRSTDIPAFYSDWFMEHLKAGYVKWYNPFNGVPLYVGKGGVNAREFTPDEMCTVAQRIGYVDAGRVCDAERRKVAQTFRPRFHSPRRFAILASAMLRQSFTDFIFATNTDGSGKAVSYVRALDMLGPILAKHYLKPIIDGSIWHGFSLADIHTVSRSGTRPSSRLRRLVWKEISDKNVDCLIISPMHKRWYNISFKKRLLWMCQEWM